MDDVQREKQRREMGQQMQLTREQMEKEKRMRDFAKQKREKDEARRERERLRAEYVRSLDGLLSDRPFRIARDKAERRSHGGKLGSVLGKDGYNPAGTSASIAQDIAAHPETAHHAPHQQHADGPVDPAQREAMVDKAIATLSKYRVGGDGGKALKVLIAYTRNIGENPEVNCAYSIPTRFHGSNRRRNIEASSLIIMPSRQRSHGVVPPK